MSVERTNTRKLRVGFAGPTAAGDLYPAFEIAKHLKKYSIEMEWRLIGWDLPSLQDYDNVEIAQADRYLVMEAVSSENPSNEALKELKDSMDEYRQSVYEASFNWDAVIIAPAAFLCPVSENCAVYPLFFQNNFDHPDCWFHDTPSYEIFASKFDILKSPNTKSLLLWDENIYHMDPNPDVNYEYVGVSKTTCQKPLPEDLQKFLSSVEQRKCIYVTMGSTSIRQQEDWLSLIRNLSMHAALVMDCRNQPLDQSEVAKIELDNPVYFVEEDVNLDALFEQVDWIACHGGFGTSMQAIWSEKPLLIMPGHFEQQWWCKKHVSNGYAQHLDISSLDNASYLSNLLDESVWQKCSNKAKQFKNVSSFEGLKNASELIYEQVKSKHEERQPKELAYS